MGPEAYPNGTTATFGISATTVYSPEGTTRYIFAGWSCSGSGCYSGSSPSDSVVMNDNIVENADWITQYLLFDLGDRKWISESNRAELV